MGLHEAAVVLYLLNFSLLATHQIDSAYWREWELFHVPGGNQLNLAANLILLISGMAGFWLVVDVQNAGQYFSLVLGLAGAMTGLIHALFLAQGDHRFRQPASIAVLVLALPVSLVQIAVSITELS